MGGERERERERERGREREGERERDARRARPASARESEWNVWAPFAAWRISAARTILTLLTHSSTSAHSRMKAAIYHVLYLSRLFSATLPGGTATALLSSVVTDNPTNPPEPVYLTP